MSYRAVPSSPERLRNSVSQQMTNALHRDSSPLERSEHVFAEPNSALRYPPGPSYEYGVTASSSQNNYQEPGAELPVSLEASANALSCFGFSSCEEDADGEPDESFTSQHSFWTTNPGDTSASTVDTVDLDEPIPLLGRDGQWKGGTSPSKAAQYYSLQSQNISRRSASRADHPLYHEDRVENSLVSRSAPYQGTRLKTAAAETDTQTGFAFDSAEKRKDVQQDMQLQDGSMANDAVGKAERASKKQSQRSTSSKKAKSSKTINSAVPRHASSEVGSGSSARCFSSPASSLGRYRLRRKESVPVLSLTELLTPPPIKPASPFNEAGTGPVDWHDEDRHYPVQPLQYNREARRHSQHAEHQPHELKEGESPQDRAHGSGSGQSDGEEAAVGDINLKMDPEEAAQDQLEETMQPAPVRNRGTRTFPRTWEIHPDFPLLYQRYSVPSSVSPEVLEMLLRHLDFAEIDEHFNEIVDRDQRSHGAFNRPRSILDLYTPRFVKGVSAQKVGMCPICYEDGEVNFLKTKFSAYNYHLQNFHGVSASTGLPFIPPTHFRGKRRTHVKHSERAQIIQGLCHCCGKYIDMQGPKDTEIKVPEIYWWKHAQVCHRKGTTPEGVGGYFVEDTWFERVCGVLELIDGYDSEISKLLSDSK
ncbi:hypothetical protein EX895_006514 [Sporisorium graminicola]|uniref:Transcription regulator Rua1 C-terminal domain-containing protein n=1 Tax=Sporisorium graminicola TaxID=280036 RepID=A0A4U7KNV6_9BASI|nr:hypothetical protein EX895_006514 [Sporisorium graminicola]TKY84612.1 hypothetical protein EX895_006514 [Sporisorium graminicola]